MAKKKRKYTHKKGRVMPVEHGSPVDEIDHSVSGTPLSSYKTPIKSKNFI